MSTPSADRVFIFAGPSLHRSGIDVDADPALTWLKPACRGDFDRLMEEHPEPGTVGLADGTFHAYPSVAHREIREAMAAGWRVYGLCSMGAIRVCEMAHMGMIPFGKVASMFIDNPDLPDDEVALIHGTEAPFLPITEPLIHIRAYLDAMVQAGHLDGLVSAELQTRLSQRWFGHRNLGSVRSALETLPGVWNDALKEGLKSFDAFRLKQIDLREFVTAKPWLQHS